MGYRSEWALKVAGTPEQVEAFVDELTRRASQVTAEAYDAPCCASTIFHSRLDDKPYGEGKIVAWWYDDSTKCYGKWDNVIQELINFAQTLRLQVAYARIGEDLGDTEFIQPEYDFFVLYRCELILDD